MLASTSSSGSALQQQHAGRQSLHPAAAALRNPLLAPRRRLASTLNALRPNQSFGEESDLDADLAAELRARNDPKRADAERMAQHYDLLWKATKSRGQVQKCSCCSGTGEKECDWCHGTGFMTVGDRVFTGGKNECPVCKAKGYVKCDFCRGTGSRAQWMPNRFDSQKQGGASSGSS